jgi:hypothetical protein
MMKGNDDRSTPLFTPTVFTSIDDYMHGREELHGWPPWTKDLRISKATGRLHMTGYGQDRGGYASHTLATTSTARSEHHDGVQGEKDETKPYRCRYGDRPLLLSTWTVAIS